MFTCGEKHAIVFAFGAIGRKKLHLRRNRPYFSFCAYGELGTPHFFFPAARKVRHRKNVLRHVRKKKRDFRQKRTPAQHSTIYCTPSGSKMFPNDELQTKCLYRTYVFPFLNALDPSLCLVRNVR